MITSLHRVIFISFTCAELFGVCSYTKRCCWHSQPGTLAEGTQTINFGPENPVGDSMVGGRRRGITPKLGGPGCEWSCWDNGNGLNSVHREVMRKEWAREAGWVDTQDGLNVPRVREKRWIRWLANLRWS